jgi:hypothetical protein
MSWMRRKAAGVLIVTMGACNATCATAGALTPYRYEEQAHRHCPADAVVWLDFRKGIYYGKRQSRYAMGFDGSFVCREDARIHGYRRSLLGLR